MRKIFSLPAKILTWLLALSFMMACGGDEPVDPTPPTPVTPVDPTPPTPEKDTTAPTINVAKSTINVISGPSITVSGNELKIGDDLVASWKDDKSTICTVVLTITTNGTSKTINSGDKLSEEGKLKVKVTDEAGNSSTAEISLTAIAVYGLENLQGKTLQVDQEVNLLEGVTFAEGLTLQKVEIEQDGTRSEIAHPEAYSPQIPGTVGIVLTLARTDGSTIEVKVDNLTVKGIQYQAMKITDLKPEKILPIIGQIEAGDKNVYSYIEHLRVAEATRIRDMMWEYGAGSHSAEKYQELMRRLYTGMTLEIPKGYDNFIRIGGLSGKTPSEHAAGEWSIINNLLNHATLCVIDPDTNYTTWDKALLDFIDENPQALLVLGFSAGKATQDKGVYELAYGREGVKTACMSNKFILFVAGSNIQATSSWVLNIIYNDEYEIDEHWTYYQSSLANSDKNSHPDRHIMVTIATNKTGDIDQTGIKIESSKFPLGFADNVLFSGRAFPEIAEGIVFWRSWRYPTSDANYFNVALTSLCFQMFAEAADMDQLLSMIRATCLTNYIHLDLNEDGDTNDIIDGHPETVPLQLINPGGFFKKYCMPSSTPASIGTNETIDLEKGYYKGLIFNIPGAEVLVNGEWIPFTAENYSRIKSANPMNLEWRLNGALLRKYGYTPGQTLQGQIITVDDQWNGLRLEVPISITIR